MRNVLFALILFTGSIAVAQESAPSQWFHDITIPAGQTVRSAQCIFCSIHVQGTVSDEAVAFLGDVNVSGSIGTAVSIGGTVHLNSPAQAQHDCVAVTGDVVLEPQSSVGGDAVAVVGVLQRGDGVSIAGDADQSPWPLLSRLPPRPRWVILLWLLGLGLSLILAALAFLTLRPARLENIYAAIRTRTVLTILIGTGILIASAIALSWSDGTPYEDSVQSVVTVLLLLLLAPGYTAISMRLGKRYFSRPIAAALAGTLILVTLQAVPLAGWVLLVILAVLAGGSLFAGRFGSAAAKAASAGVRSS